MLKSSEIEELRKKNGYGYNVLTPPPETPWWKLYLEKFRDPIIIILLVATGISLLFGFVNGDFIESIGIIFAILIATGVGFWQEYSAKKKFDEMKSSKNDDLVKVKRDNTIIEVPKSDLIPGDIVLLSAGNEVPADIKILKSVDLLISEACMTGESEAVEKYPLESEYSGSGYAPNLALKGTIVETGHGEGVVVAIGDNTELGKTTRSALQENRDKTPLELKLDKLADKITIAAFIIASVMFIILNITHWKITPFEWSFGMILQEIKFLMASVVVIIVAVPEGLPLAVTLSLAFSMKTMAKENNLVKKMHACETIGATNVIFTDKTGTLTKNQMEVVETSSYPNDHLDMVGTLCNSAEWSINEKNNVVLGNPTDCAILRHVSYDQYKEIHERWKIVDVIPFNSQNKFMVSFITGKNDERPITSILIKGAPEVIAKLLGNEEQLELIELGQESGKRAISAATLGIIGSDKQEDINLLKEKILNGKCVFEDGEYIGTWYIEDPIREDVPDAIEQCYKSGIDVVMMTGDNIKTATEIAKQAGFEDIWAIEAKDFEKEIKSGDWFREYPNVIARCTPEDKFKILNWAQGKGYVCAMTGDGVNDSSSLNKADVGIAMGSGTDLAKEASDIILLDDAFPSIITGIKWGRSLYKNIQNFLYLQLSINVSACLIAVFGPLVGVEMPFTVIQFLWINLVMDSLASIALASEPADPRVLEEKPRDKNEFIINKNLAKSIFGFGGVIWILCTGLLWGVANTEFLSKINLTMFFAGYMILNWWNMFNARVIGRNKSIVDGLFSNYKFYGIMILILLVTIGIVQLGGDVFRTEPLKFWQWIIIFVITSPVVILKEIFFRLKKG